VGAVLREQNALPYGGWIMVKLTAKDDVDNVGAGRAAKGENPSLRAIEKTPKVGCFLLFFRAFLPIFIPILLAKLVSKIRGKGF
jgi:hypothetical protein